MPFLTDKEAIEREARQIMEEIGVSYDRAVRIVYLNHDDPRGHDIVMVDDDGNMIDLRPAPGTTEPEKEPER